MRELKEQALALYEGRRYAECAHSYAKLLELEPGDPHLHVRHAEAWRRAGERHKAVASYRTAAELLLSLGCEARARAALKVALELEPGNPELALALERLRPASIPRREEVHLPASPTSSAQVRRLSAHTLAVRMGARWLVVSSRTPLRAYEVEDLTRVLARESLLETNEG